MNNINLKTHNQESFEKVLEMIRNHDEVALVQATGTGKTYVGMKLVETLFIGKKVLWVGPTNSILHLVRANKDFSHLFRYIVFTTYSSLKKFSKESFDLVVLDELHRAGASKWQEYVNQIKYGKLFGMSATPIRYLDNHRDMTEELFNGNVVEGPDIFYAVENGILPKFTYITALFNEVEMLNQLKEVAIYRKKDEIVSKIDKLVLEINDENIKNKKIIQDIINSTSSINKRNQKWIVFFKTIKELEEYKNLMKWYFNADNVYSIHSNLDSNTNKEILFNFNNNTNGINLLLSVNSLSEGVHVNNLDGILMLRKTISPIIFNQQLGRALSNSSINKHPIIFDFVGNYLHIEKGKLEYNRWCTIGNGNISSDIDRFKQINGIIFKDFEIKFKNLVNSIKRLINDWTEEEIKILKEKYAIYGYEIPELLGRHTKDGIHTMAKRLGMFKYKKWSVEDVEILKKYYPLKGTNIPELLDRGHTISSIKGKVNRLKLDFSNKKIWEENDILLLKEKYPTQGSNIPELLEKFSINAIGTKARSLGLNFLRNKSSRLWTDKEIEILKEYYPLKGTNIPELLEKYRKNQITYKAALLGLSKSKINFKEEDIEILKEKFPTQGSNIPELLEKYSRYRILSEAKKLNLNYFRKNEWTEEDIKILKEKYPTQGSNIPELLAKYNKHLITSKASILGIRYRNEWTEEDIKILKEKYPTQGSNIPELLEKFSKSSIYNKSKKYNICYNDRSDRCEWTDEEIEILKEYYPTQGINIPELLDRGHSESSLHQKALSLNIKFKYFWTDEDIKILKEKFPTQYSNIPELLKNWSPKQIRRKAKGLKIKFLNKLEWTDEEIEILKEKFPTQKSSIPELLDKFSKSMILDKAREYNLNNYTVTWSDEEIEILKEKFPTQGGNIVELLKNHTKSAITSKAIRLGVSLKSKKA